MAAFHSIIGLLTLVLFSFCTSRATSDSYHSKPEQPDSLQTPDTLTYTAETSPEDEDDPNELPEIKLEKELLYDKYTLEDSYTYGKTQREFQWEKIKERLALLESYQRKRHHWGILSNYKNMNGQAQLVKGFKRNQYGRTADTLGVERYQGVPFYALTDTLQPVIYGRDGNLVRILTQQPTNGSFLHIQTVYPEMKEWLVPKRYVKSIGDTVKFEKAIFVDRHNQNITTLEKSVDKWLIRSMNPATTGRFRPPYAQHTPLGLFVVQAKKSKMVYLKDGSNEVGGFAPYANRFTNGAYIHGVPVVAPGTELIEYSYSLGTTPRSHMCVRNATSHSKFIYNWGSINKTIVFVLE